MDRILLAIAFSWIALPGCRDCGRTSPGGESVTQPQGPPPVEPLRLVKLDPIHLLVSESDVAWFSKASPRAMVTQRIVTLNGRVVGLDLRGADLQASMTLIRSNPFGTAAMTGEMPVLCHRDLLELVRTLGTKKMWRGFGEDGFVPDDLPACLESIEADELYISVPASGADLTEKLSGMRGLLGIDVAS
jgi:hypothetical protein